ncbi:glycosyltransferase family 25 protein [Ruegeria sp. R14_0]|uniref:glycosyltransferase family 25 protein n=1 Tax=Ruegeria sp. R14_0 TaxID=2821100 RepID=UPI001ADD1CD6|nr:glycosyltransferase family 25 protein [Ruegeria sp. R14_0]
MGRHALPPQTGAFYINLDRVPARQAFMETQFNHTGLAGALRFSATDAQNPDALVGNGYVPGTGSRWGLKTSEIACFESHRAVWKAALDQNLQAVAVFEDDVEMSTQAGAVIAGLLGDAGGYDMVKLDYSPRSLRFGPEESIAGVPVRPMLEMAPSAAAYVLSLEGCRKLLSWSERYSDHLDDFISIPRPDWRMYQCFPAVGVQMIWSKQQDHTVEEVKVSERSQDRNINSGLDKGPTWFRIRRELLATRRKLYWRMGGQARLLQSGGFVGFIPCADDLQV